MGGNSIMKTILLCLILSVYTAAFSQQRVFVVDGDTFFLNGLKIRLYGIDSPELRTPFATQSKNKLKELITNGKITYKIITIDKYNRYVCKVYCAGKDVSYEMIRTGYAFCYHRYCNELSYKEAEIYARKKKLGVWKCNIINPEKYRHGQRKAHQ